MSLNKQNKGDFFNSLQIFRGFAALMVVFHHQWTAFAYFFDKQNHIFAFIATLGKHGVDFFFVLSGFIITYSCYNKRASIITIKSYLINRVLRIYIPYLPISLCMLLLYQLLPSVSGSDRTISLLTSLTLFPDGQPALSVAWTLVHEMMFYLLFVIWFYTRKGWYYFTLVWASIIVYLNWIEPVLFLQAIPVIKFFISSYNLEFIIGSFTAIIIKKASISSKSIFLYSAIVLIAIGILLKWNNWNLTYLVLAFGFSLLIIGSVGTKLDKIGSSNLLMILGNASYSIYLIHNPEISILMRILPKTLNFLSDGLIFVIIFIICCITGIIYSKLFEEFLMSKAKAKFLPTSPKKTELKITN